MDEFSSKYHLLIGTTSGLILRYENGEFEKHRVSAGSTRKVSTISWGRVYQEILVGYEDGYLDVYNYVTGVTKPITLIGDCQVVGIGTYNNDFVIGFENGEVYYMNEEMVTKLRKNDRQVQLTAFKINPYDDQQLLLGTNNLVLFNLETKDTIFTSKADPHDELNLPVETTFSGIHCLIDGKRIGACTKEGQVRLYDPTAQRRAVMQYNTKTSFCSITGYNDTEIFTGCTKGIVRIYDIRKFIEPVTTCIHATGAIISLEADQDNPMLICCSLDENFYVGKKINDKWTGTHKQFFGMKPCGMLFRRKYFAVPIAAMKRDDEERGSQDS